MKRNRESKTQLPTTQSFTLKRGKPCKSIHNQYISATSLTTSISDLNFNYEINTLKNKNKPPSTSNPTINPHNTTTNTVTTHNTTFQLLFSSLHKTLKSFQLFHGPKTPLSLSLLTMASMVLCVSVLVLFLFFLKPLSASSVSDLLSPLLSPVFGLYLYLCVYIFIYMFFWDVFFCSSITMIGVYIYIYMDVFVYRWCLQGCGMWERKLQGYKQQCFLLWVWVSAWLETDYFWSHWSFQILTLCHSQL